MGPLIFNFNRGNRETYSGREMTVMLHLAENSLMKKEV
jgi:hypothetical protein